MILRVLFHFLSDKLHAQIQYSLLGKALQRGLALRTERHAVESLRTQEQNASNSLPLPSACFF